MSFSKGDIEICNIHCERIHQVQNISSEFALQKTDYGLKVSIILCNVSAFFTIKDKLFSPSKKYI